VETAKMGGLMMKMVKSAILATAGMFAVAGTAYAADLPVRKAPEKVFVEVCTNYEGYYRIPGTDTCVRIGGYVRMDWGYGGGTTATPNQAWSRASSLNSQFTRWVLVMDARPMTDVGPARIYANIIVGNVTNTAGGYGNANVGGGATLWTGTQGASTIFVQLAYIQLHGWEFGYNYSIFDYLHTQYFMHVMYGGSDRWITGIRYTAAVTKEFSATIAIEDPGARRQPILGVSAIPQPLLGGLAIGQLVPGATVPPNLVPPLPYTAGWAGKSIFPEIVGRLAYRGAWGDVAIMGALHEVRPAYATSGLILTGPTGFPASLPAFPGANGVGFITPDTKIGGAVQGGLTIKTPGGMNPKIADTIAFEASYGKGAFDYIVNCSGPVGNSCFGGMLFSKGSNFAFSKQNFILLSGDAVFNPTTGALDLVDAWNVGVRYRHFWTPYLRSIHGFSYSVVNFNGPAITNVTPGVSFGVAAGAPNGALVGADYKILDVTNELIWSPYTDLDLGIGVTYQKFDPTGPKSYEAWAGMFRAQWNW